MKGLDRRLRQLEASSGINEPGLAVIVRTGVPRANDGAEDPGPVWATIIAGPNRGVRLIRADGEPEAAFLVRVDKAQRGCPA
jgi:hypothetical protein